MTFPGQQFGPYTCVHQLGRGGMGETWLGVQRRTDGFEQRVCLKFVREAARDRAHAGELFRREAAIAASLRHSNIVGVIDADVSSGYLALELVDGTDLRTLLHETGSGLSASLVIQIAVELCKALEYAHTRTRGAKFAGVVHRDLSPGNVLISRAGEVKLADFGIAQLIRTGGRASVVRGKLSYMAPEQAAGQPADARSDLFSLGVLLYELLCGERPFDGASDADTVRRIMEGKYVPLSQRAGHPPVAALASVVDRLLRRARAERFRTAAEVLDALAPLAPPATVTFELAALVQRARPARAFHLLAVSSRTSAPAARPPPTPPTPSTPLPGAAARRRPVGRRLLLSLFWCAVLGSTATLMWSLIERGASADPSRGSLPSSASFADAREVGAPPARLCLASCRTGCFRAP